MADTKQTGLVTAVPADPADLADLAGPAGPAGPMDELDDNKTISTDAFYQFEEKIKYRSTPYTYLDHDYDIKGANTHDKRVFSNVLRALLGCATFVDKLRHHMYHPVAKEFRKIIEVIAYNSTYDPDITNLYKRFNEAMVNVNTKTYIYREHGDVIRYLMLIWKNSRFRKIFAITRANMGYCIVCKNYGPAIYSDYGPYVVKKNHLLDPEYDIEDSLYAERNREKYLCATCGMSTDYKLLITTSPPDVITIVPPAYHMKFEPPIEIVLPCEETRTHYYTLASFIYAEMDNEENGVCIITNESTKMFKTGNKRFTEFVPNIKYYNLLCYVKVGTIDNYARVID